MAVRQRSKSCDSFMLKELPEAVSSAIIPKLTSPKTAIIPSKSVNDSEKEILPSKSSHHPSTTPQIDSHVASVTSQIDGWLPVIDKVSGNEQATTGNNVKADIPVVKPKVKKGLISQQKWNEAEEKQENKKEEAVKKKSWFFSKRGREALKNANVTTTKKPPVLKKDSYKVSHKTLIVLQAIADGRFDNLVTAEEKEFIQRNSKYRKHLIAKMDNNESLRFENIIYKRLLKRQWYANEKIAVEILKSNKIDAILLSIIVSLEDRRKRFKNVATAIIEMAEFLVFPDLQDDDDEDEKENDNDIGNIRASSRLSGGGLIEDDDSGANRERSPTPFSTDSQDGDNDGDADDHNDSVVDEDLYAFFRDQDSPTPSQNGNDDREEGELTPSDDGEEDTPFDYENPDPPRSTRQEGVYAFNCFNRLKDQQYENILLRGMANPELCHKEYPYMFPEPGMIVLHDVDAVRQKWGLKNRTEAQSEVRCDGWSWTPSSGKKSRKKEGQIYMKVDHFQGRNQNTGLIEKGQPFSCWQYTTPDQRWQLLHYVGNTSEIATGFPHGNSKTGKPYLRSCPSLLRQLMRDSTTDKPTVVYQKFYNDMDQELMKNSQLQLVKGPRNDKQIENARYQALNWGRLSTNTISNVVEMSIRLVYPGYFLPDSKTPRSFIDTVGLTPTNLYIHMENPLIFEEMGRIIKETGAAVRLRYDTTFKLGDFFLSMLSWEHPYFKKNIILGGYIHDSKAHERHEEFFKKLWKNNQNLLKDGNFVLITDGEFHLTNIWPRLVNLYCFEHLKQNAQRKLVGKGRLFRELCNQLLIELQKMETEEKYDEKLDDCLSVMDNEKLQKIFKYYGDKMKERCSRYAILKANLPDAVVDTQGAESLNALVKRYKPKDSLFADEMIVILFYISQQQYAKIIKGYYRNPQGYSMAVDYFDKIRGNPGQVPNIAFTPGINEITSFIRDKSTLPIMPGMKNSGPMKHYMGTANPNVPNAMARELLEKKRVTQSPDNDKHFLVHDMTDKIFAVYVRNNNLVKQDYECSCKSKNCIHLRAVFFYLGFQPAEIPFISQKDPLQSLLGNRSKGEKPAGEKAPRKGETKKDYASEEEEVDDDKNGDMSLEKDDGDNAGDAAALVKSKRKASQQESDTAATASTQQEEHPVKRPRRLIQEPPKELDSVWDELQARSLAAMNETEVQLRDDVQRRFTLSRDIYTPPDLTVDPPPYWNEISDQVKDILYFPQLFKPNFYEVLPLLPQGRAVIFLTARENYAVCFKQTATSLIVYSMDTDLTANTPEEMAWSAAHCARDETKVDVTVYNSNDEVKDGNPEPLVLAFLKLYAIQNNEEPHNVSFNLKNLKEINFENLITIYNNRAEDAADCFIDKAVHHFYCCCKKASFEPTEERNKYLQVPKMVQCSGCKKHYFGTCVNYSVEGKSKAKWYCFNCSNYSIPNLSWGQGARNTCPLDNILTALSVMVQRHPDFIKLLATDNRFEAEIKTFLAQMGKTQSSINEAKRSFMAKAYDRTNLYGSEDILILERLLHVYGTKTAFKCPKCNDATESEPQNKLNIRKENFGTSVAETIKKVIHLENPFMVFNKRCLNDINGEPCWEMIEVETWEYAQPHPWILPIGIGIEDLNRNFGLNEVEQLPLSVEFNDRFYQLGCITFHRSNHFVAIIPVESGFCYYDGLAASHPITTLPQALERVAADKPLIGHIVYFLIPQKKK